MHGLRQSGSGCTFKTRAKFFLIRISHPWNNIFILAPSHLNQYYAVTFPKCNFIQHRRPISLFTQHSRPVLTFTDYAISGIIQGAGLLAISLEIGVDWESSLFQEEIQRPSHCYGKIIRYEWMLIGIFWSQFVELCPLGNEIFTYWDPVWFSHKCTRLVSYLRCY